MAATRLNPHYKVTPDYANSTFYDSLSINPNTWKYTATAPTIVYLSTHPIDTYRNAIVFVNGKVAGYGGYDYSTARDSNTMTSFTLLLGTGDVLTVAHTEKIWLRLVPLV